MICFLEPDIHISDEVNVVLDLSNYATKNELNDATGFDIFNSAAK